VIYKYIERCNTDSLHGDEGYRAVNMLGRRRKEKFSIDTKQGDGV
jgi:hypothetical protein